MSKALNSLTILIAFHLAVVITALDIHIPCLSMMVEHFQSTQATLQLTISIYSVGAVLGSLFFGPLADSIGRRLALFGALVGIVLSSLMCAFATNIEFLIFSRFIQGFFSAACPVIAFAIAADLFSGHQFTQATALNGLMITCALAVAPVLGSHIGTSFGWEYIFLFLAGGLSLSGGLLLWFLPETLKEKKPIHIANICSGYFEIASNFRFIGYGSLPSLVLGAMIAYLGAAAYYFVEELGLHETVFSYFQCAALAVNALANLMTGLLVPKYGPRKLLKFGIWLAFCGAVWMGVTSILFSTSPYFLTSAQVIINISVAIIFAGATTLAMQAIPHSYGTASAVLGAFRMLIISTMAAASGFVYSGTAVSMSTVFIISLVLCFALYIIVVRHEGVTLPQAQDL